MHKTTMFSNKEFRKVRYIKFSCQNHFMQTKTQKKSIKEGIHQSIKELTLKMPSMELYHYSMSPSVDHYGLRDINL